MKAAQYRRHGNPPDVIDIVGLPVDPPGAGQVVVDMEAVAIRPQDIYSMSGKTGFEEPLPAIPGNKGVGRVTDVGQDVLLEVGDRVYVQHYPPGVWCQQIVTGAEHLFRAPEDANAAQLSLVTGNAVTSYFAFKDVVALKKGDWIVHNGANSACGRYIIQLARLWGYRTVNVVRRIGLAEELKGLGADVVVTAGPDLGARVADQTNNAQIVLGLDMISGVATAQMADCIAEGGTIATYGLISAEEAMVPVRDLLYKDLRLVGYFMGRSRQKRSRGDMEKVYEEISGLIRDGVLCAKIAATYGLEEVKEAVAHQTKSGEAKPGKIVLLCDQ